VWGRDTTAGRQYAPTATTDMHLMRARRMATTDLTGLSAECSSAQGRGMADTAEAITAVDITAAEVITDGEAMAVAITAAGAMVRATAAEAMATEVAPMDAQPTVDAVMPWAATAPAAVEAGSAAVEVGSMAAEADMAAAIANWFGRFSNYEKPTIQVVGLTAQASSGPQPTGRMSRK
jgi:hypothetical protein